MSVNWLMGGHGQRGGGSVQFGCVESEARQRGHPRCTISVWGWGSPKRLPGQGVARGRKWSCGKGPGRAEKRGGEQTTTQRWGRVLGGSTGSQFSWESGDKGFRNWGVSTLPTILESEGFFLDHLASLSYPPPLPLP